MKRRRGLTPEEEALWRKAMRDVAPFRGKKPSLEALVSKAKETRPGNDVGPIRRAPALGRAHAPTPLSPRAEHPFAAGDPRLDRLAGRGRLAIDAVLDLHGHSQRTARGVLGRFVAEQHGKGARCLLVITGKGAPSLSFGGAEKSFDQGAGRGVLKARLHDWLAEEPLRKLISRASPAHPRHGGGGAFYIFLKR